MAVVDVQSVLQNALKENYTGQGYNTVVTRSETLDLFKENSQVHDGPEGKYFLLADMIGNPEGIGARLEHDFLPEGGTPVFINPRVALKTNFAMIQTTWKAMKNAAQGPASFVSWADATIAPALRSLTDDLDRQAVGYASGIVARMATTATGLVIPLDRPWGIGAGSTPKATLPGLRRGRKVIISPNADGSNPRGGGVAARITSADPFGNSGTGSITVDAVPSGATTDDYLFFGDDYGSNAPGINGSVKEMMGLEGMFDDGTVLDTLENVSRTTYPEWKSIVTDASAAPFSGNATDTLFMRMVDNAELWGNGRTTHLVTSRACMVNAYAYIRSTAFSGYGSQLSAGALTTGAKDITIYVGGRPLLLRAVNKFVPGRAFAIDSSTLHRFTLGQGEWDQTTGAMFKQVQSGMAVKDEFFTYYRVVQELACDDPRKGAKAIKISETVA